MTEILNLLDTSVENLNPHTVKTMTSDETIEEAIEIMRSAGIGSIVVIDSSGTIEGILTERDLLCGFYGRDIALNSPIRDLMTPNPKTVRPNDSIILALGVMTRQGFRHLPVVDIENHMIGIISLRDIMKYIAHHLQDD